MSKPVHPIFRPVLLSARDEAPGVRTFRFASPAGFRFTPGQFLMFHFADEPKTWRAYSICSAPDASRDYLEVTVGMVGDFSERLAKLEPGREAGLVVRGPFGRWTWGGEGHAVLVSGGTGITPFRSMALMKRGKVTICACAKTPEGLLFKNEYDQWRESGVTINEKVTQPGAGSYWEGRTGRWAAADVFAAANDAAAVYYLCGPKGMVEDLRDGLQRLGVPPDKIRAEKWGDYTELF